MRRVIPMPRSQEDLDFDVEEAVFSTLQLEDELCEFPGCGIININFKHPSQVGEIVFRNYYTAWITVLLKYDGLNEWKVGIQRKNLMPSPNYEAGSQDFVSIPATESAIKWSNVTRMKLILYQPSTEWKSFKVEELKFFPSLRNVPSHQSLLTSTFAKMSNSAYEISNLPTV